MKGFLRQKILGVVTAVVLALSSPAAVFADLDLKTIREYSLGNIVYYNPNASSWKGSSSRGKANCVTDGIAGSNKNYAGVQVWSDAEIRAIEENRPIYEEAAGEYGFPWQVLAVLHSQETGLRWYNPPNGQGIYQLYEYTQAGTNENRFEPSAEVTEEEFLRQSKIAAAEISSMVGDLNDEGNIKRLFFQYNGTAKQYIQKALDMGFSQEEAENGEGSYYVMNRYDAQRDPTSADMSPYWPGRFVADGVYDETATSTVFGAFVKYQALGGGSGAGSEDCVAGGIGGGSGGGNAIAETAILISWEGRRSHSKDDPKPEYVTAMQETGAYQMAYDGRPYGASCDQFVGTVLRYSGADPDYPIWGPGTQESWMVQHPDMYQRIDAGGDFSALQPGDIFVTDTAAGNHIYLYVGDIYGDGQLWQASASANDRTGEHFVGVYFSDNAGSGGSTRPYNVYRYVGV